MLPRTIKGIANMHPFIIELSSQKATPMLQCSRTLYPCFQRKQARAGAYINIPETRVTLCHERREPADARMPLTSDLTWISPIKQISWWPLSPPFPAECCINMIIGGLVPTTSQRKQCVTLFLNFSGNTDPDGWYILILSARLARARRYTRWGQLKTQNAKVWSRLKGRKNFFSQLCQVKLTTSKREIALFVWKYIFFVIFEYFFAPVYLYYLPLSA